MRLRLLPSKESKSERALKSFQARKETVRGVDVNGIRNDGGIVQIVGAADEVTGTGWVHDDKANNGAALGNGRENHTADCGGLSACGRTHCAAAGDAQHKNVELGI